MCYKKPGPRCSGHARKALRKAQVAYQKDTNYDNYVAMRKAQEEYDLTPAGQKDITAQMEAESNFEKRYMLQQRLEHAVEARQEALRAINESDQGDVDQEGHENAPSSDLPTAELPDSPLIQPSPHNDYTYASGIEHEYDSYECAYSDCDGYYCHDKEFSGLRISSVDEREFLAGEYRVAADKVPDEFVQKLKDSNFRDHVEVDAVHDYYGERAQVRVSDEMHELVHEMYFSQPNAADKAGSLRYAREEGVDTTGLRPVEAVKKTVDTSRLDKDLKRRVETAREVERTKLRIADIIHDEDAVREAVGHNFDSLKATASKVDGGIVVSNANGKYVLVGGEKRFRAVKEKGTVFWHFQALTRPVLPVARAPRDAAVKKAPKRPAATRRTTR